MKFILVVFRLFGVNPKNAFNSLRGVPFFIYDWLRYSRLSKAEDNFSIKLSDLYPVYPDRFDTAGTAKGHYFHQDLWAAKLIYNANPKVHIDVGSRIDGFVAHLLVFRDVTVVDVRPLESNVPGLTFEQSDITNLKYQDDSLESVSCLHAIEHIGLGRYGDNIDFDGWRKGLKELSRVIKPGGRLYLGVPIGRERVCFNAHRVFSANTILKELEDLELISFSYVDDQGSLQEEIDVNDVPALEYGCGLYEFTKRE